MKDNRQKQRAQCISELIYSAAAFAGRAFINYFTIPFYIVARYYGIGILGSVGYVPASYDYFVVNLQAVQLPEFIRRFGSKTQNIILSINPNHRSQAQS